MQQVQTAGEQAKSAARFTSLKEWFLRDQAIANARREQLPPRQKSEVQAARRPTVVGKTLLDSSAEASDTSYAVLSLCREAVYWSLCALRQEQKEANPNLADLFAALPREQALKLAGGEDNLALVTEVLIGQTFVETAELDDNRAYAAAVASQQFAEQLLALAEGPDKKLERVNLQRWFRPLLAFVAILIVLYGLKTLVGSFGKPRDLAEGKTWRTSSVYPGLNFAAAGKMGGPKAFDELIFHTNAEDSPWMEIDLGAPIQVKGVYVKNRKSCCGEAAVPLVVEVSENQKDWAEATRRVEIFAEWTEFFAPKTARYVRFRVARRSALHLDTIRVY